MCLFIRYFQPVYMMQKPFHVNSLSVPSMGKETINAVCLYLEQVKALVDLHGQLEF